MDYLHILDRPAIQWFEEFEINVFDNNYSLGADSFDAAVDSTSNIYVVGSRDGSTAKYNGWMANYNASGKGLWSQFLGSTAIDIAITVAVDGNGNVYVSTDWEREKEKAKISPFRLLQNYCCNKSI